MIKIISGVFGFNTGNGVVPKTPDDEPFEAGKELEARLVKEGIAVYAGPSLPDESESNEPDGEGDSLEAFTKAQLIEKFNELGLEGNPNKMNKSQLIEAIENAPVDGEASEEGEESEEESDEDAPEFGEDDGVVD